MKTPRASRRGGRNPVAKAVRRLSPKRIESRLTYSRKQKHKGRASPAFSLFGMWL